MAAKSSDSNPTPATVLLVDDNRHGILARRSILQELGYEITVSMCPLEALDLFSKQTFDLVITDFKMPQLNGVELIAKLRKINPSTPAILVTGFADSLGFTEENTGADAIVQKSANEVQQLLRAVTRVLRKKTPKKPVSSITRRTRIIKTKAKGVS